MTQQKTVVPPVHQQWWNDMLKSIVAGNFCLKNLADNIVISDSVSNKAYACMVGVVLFFCYDYITFLSIFMYTFTHIL